MKMINSEFRTDIEKIFNAGVAGTGTFMLTASGKTSAGLTFKILRIHEYTTTRDYLNGMTDLVKIVCEVDRATYEHIVYPNRADLIVSITKTACDKNGDNPQSPSTSDFRALLLDPQDNTFTAATLGGDTIQEKEVDSFHLAFQLMDSEYEKYKEVLFSTVIYDDTPKESIETVVSNFGTYPIAVHQPDNTDRFAQLVVEEGIPLCEYANWLQNQAIGVYNHGINTYYFKPWIHVYPPLLADAHPDRRRHVIYRLAPTELVGEEHTYRVEGDIAHIVTTGEVDFSDTTLERERDMGNVIHFDEKPNYLDDRVIHKDGKTTFENTGWNTALRHERVIQRMRTHKRQTGNKYREYSRLVEAEGKFVELTWENPNPSLFPPNTEVEIYYLNGGTTFKLEGVVTQYKQEAREAARKGPDSVFKDIANLRIRIAQ